MEQINYDRGFTETPEKYVPLANKKQSLIERVAKRDNDGVRACVEKYGSLVWGISRKFTATNLEAEQMTEDIFSKVWSCAHRFDPKYFTDKSFITTIALDFVKTQSGKIVF